MVSKGKIPVIKKTGFRFKCNMLAAIIRQGFITGWYLKITSLARNLLNFLGK